ncbi:Peptidase family M48 [Capnocytophaga haemolytica]|uniref:Zn-dependent protease, contains TPR repeats n=1 Tax=Capnocytophaga haemolytica TaxID=45243 RepID=A0AAX2GVG1_9FLAO|nr:Peptidase family M48 [Capnocytophaga haemolytica]SNV04466.1 Putative Zn-dependent protease, contains TPR repeats [Capnocytophaga haemolytica]
MIKRITLIALLLTAFSCKTNPFTGKSTLNFMPNSTVFPMAFSQYSQFLSENKVVKGTKDAEMVKRVGQRIAKAAQLWLDANGYKGYLDDYRWEYNLVQDKQVNAWCMPGGKIVVYTGILPITQTEAGLAVVMGHEVAHALADHGAQRMSASTLQQIGLLAGSVALQSSKYASLTNEFGLAYGLATQVGVMLPFSRSNETEADAIGIQIMAIAGYDPAEAPELWKRMSAQSGGGSGSALLSTHPTNESRIRNLTALVPKARAEAAKFGVTSFQ